MPNLIKFAVYCYSIPKIHIPEHKHFTILELKLFLFFFDKIPRLVDLTDEEGKYSFCCIEC